MAVLNSAPGDGVVHIVSGRPTPVADIVGFACRMFGLSGVSTAGAAEFVHSSPNAFEAAFEQMIEVYRPYMSDRRSFSMDNAAPILSRAGLTCPRFSYDVFERCMSYAVSRGWGKFD